MLRTLSLSRLWAVLGLGVLLLFPFFWAQSQPLERRAASRQQDAQAVSAARLQQAEVELLVKRTELQALETRLKTELEHKRLEVRVAEERLRQAKERFDQGGAAPVPGAAPPVTAEQRLQQLEQKIELLQNELAALRRQAPVQRATQKKFTPLDLQAKMNHKSKDTFHSGRYPGNTLASLPTGEQTFHKIKFQIGAGVIQLGSTQIEDKPAKVTGIPVGKRFPKLHILHATGYSLVEPDTRIGAYTVRFEDGTSATIPIVYGQDVLDWWKYPGNPEPTRGKVAWEGANEAAKEFDATIRLYLTSWENPHPDKTVTSIDYASTMDTPCAPFCVALTVEEP